MMLQYTGMADTDNYSGMTGRYILKYSCRTVADTGLNSTAAAGIGWNSKDIEGTADIDKTANNSRYCMSGFLNSQLSIAAQYNSCNMNQMLRHYCTYMLYNSGTRYFPGKKEIQCIHYFRIDNLSCR